MFVWQNEYKWVYEQEREYEFEWYYQYDIMGECEILFKLWKSGQLPRRADIYPSSNFGLPTKLSETTTLERFDFPPPPLSRACFVPAVTIS